MYVFPQEVLASVFMPSGVYPDVDFCFIKAMSGCQDGYVWRHVDFIDRSPRIKKAELVVAT